MTSLPPPFGVDPGGGSARGKSIIAGPETLTAPASYTLASTPDQVASIVLPTDGIIGVLFRAAWKPTVTLEGRAAIFLGANQLTRSYEANSGAAVQEAIGNEGNLYSLLGTTSGGLKSQYAGFSSASNQISGITNGQIVGPGSLGSTGAGYSGDRNDETAFGPTYIEAAAGTYTVSVKYKAASGNILVANRKLWVWAMGF